MDPNQQPQQQPQTNNYEQPQMQAPPTPPYTTEPQQGRDKKMLILLTTIIILGLVIGALSYKLISKEDKAANNTTETTETTTEDEINTIRPTDTDVADEKSDLETQSSAYGFSYKYPRGEDWKSYISDQPNSDGTKATGGVNYVKCGVNCGFALTMYIAEKGSSADQGASYGETAMQGNTYYTLSKKETVTKGAATGTRWEYTPGDDKAAPTIFYYFTKDNTSYMFKVNENGAITDSIDITKAGEEIIATLMFDN